MSYQHDDPPDADHYSAGGHLRPAEQERRHVGVRGFYFGFLQQTNVLLLKPKDDSPTDPPGQLIRITRVYSGDFDPRRDRDARSKATNENDVHVTPLPLALTNALNGSPLRIAR
ncbi:hypothetical protein INR49_030038 [Caranx melampygus]|nr:hypothetical protein INR49_030038 [Caranx melampygus]